MKKKQPYIALLSAFLLSIGLMASAFHGHMPAHDHKSEWAETGTELTESHELCPVCGVFFEAAMDSESTGTVLPGLNEPVLLPASQRILSPEYSDNHGRAPPLLS